MLHLQARGRCLLKLLKVAAFCKSARDYLEKYLRIFIGNFWALTIICLIVFYSNGFYTYGRWYRSRYKLVLIAQAGTTAFMVFAVANYFFPPAIILPRTVLLGAWLLTLLLLISTRLWSNIWKAITAQEIAARQTPPERTTEKILVIGGGGYIGSALLPLLLKAGYKVRLADLLLFGKKPIAPYLDHPNLEVVQADFRHIDKMVECMRGIDSLVHLGGIVGDPACALDEELTLDVNLMANRMVTEVAKGCSVKQMIFASSCSVYGHGDEILDEHSKLQPLSLYAKTKKASEEMILQVTSDSTLSPVLLRFSTLFGFSGRIRFDLLVNLLTAKAVVEGKITIFNGDTWRPFLHVEDAARAILTCLEAPRQVTHRQAFNVGSDAQNHRISDVGQIICGLVPGAKIVETESDGDRRNYRVEFKKIRNHLEFTSRWNLEQGILQVKAAIEEGKVRDYRDPLYSNFRYFKDGGLMAIKVENGDWIYQLLET